MPVRLLRVEIKNYRSIFGDTPLKFDVSPGVNTFVGPNNAGKSNILRAIALAFSDRDAVQFSRERDQPQQLWWARPSITLLFEVVDPTLPEKTLLRRAREYEQSVLGKNANTNARKRLIRLRVKYQGDTRQEFIAIAGVGDRRGDQDKNKKALEQLAKCVRFVYVQSGEDIRRFLSGRFNEVLQSVLKEADKQKFDQVQAARSRYLLSLERDLLDELTKALNRRIKRSFSEITDVKLRPDVPPLDDSVAATSVTLTDGATTDINDKGTGIRGGLLISMLRYLVDHSRRSLVFAIEEPEAFLHPGAQTNLNQELERLAHEANACLLVSSHSPFMLSRSDSARAFSIEKLSEGNTYIEDQATGQESFSKVLSPLFHNVVLPGLIDDVANLPNTIQAVIVVEGYTDKIYFEEAARLSGDRDIGNAIVIRGCEGAYHAAAEAVIWNARKSIPVVVILDHDKHGIEVRKMLYSKFKLPKKYIFTYDRWMGDGHAWEAEDLFPRKLVSDFVSNYGRDRVVSEMSKFGNYWHYGFNQEGKRHFLDFLQANSTKKDFQKFEQALEDVKSELLK